jgi:hypothetical protein
MSIAVKALALMWPVKTELAMATAMEMMWHPVPATSH